MRFPFAIQQGGCALLYIAFGHTIKERNLLDDIYSIPVMYKVLIFFLWLPSVYFGGVSIGECNFKGKLLPVTFLGTLAGSYCFIGLFKRYIDRKLPLTTYTLWIMLAQSFLQFLSYYNEDFFHITVSPFIEMIVLFAGSFLLAFPIKCIVEIIPVLKSNKK